MPTTAAPTTAAGSLRRPHHGPAQPPGPGQGAGPGSPSQTAPPRPSVAGEAEPEVEPNDDAAQATAITAGAWEGALSDGDTDWYSLDVPAGAVADIALTAGSSAGGLQVLVYDAKNAHLWDDTAGTDQTVSFRRIEGGRRVAHRGARRPGRLCLQAPSPTG